jgi:hypothetical protein
MRYGPIDPQEQSMSVLASCSPARPTEGPSIASKELFARNWEVMTDGMFRKFPWVSDDGFVRLLRLWSFFVFLLPNSGHGDLLTQFSIFRVLSAVTILIL